MFWLRTAHWRPLCVALALLSGCDAPPPPEPIVNPPQPLAESPILDPVHLGEDRLRSPLLDGLHRQIENSETDETRSITEPLKQQLVTADEIMSEARTRNRTAIQQANRQVRMGAARQSPNFLLLTVDRMGIGDLGHSGQPHWKTPALDHWAASGLEFSHCYSGLTPANSLSAILTARFDPIAPNAKGKGLMPQVLWNAGYRTALIGKWSGEMSPASQGYETSSGWNAAAPEFPEWALLNEKPITLENNVGGKQDVTQSDFLISEVRSFLREARGGPNQFFLHISIRAFDDVAIRSLNVEGYASRIRLVDSFVGRTRDVLEEFGLANHTCVIFLALGGPHPELTELIRETQSAGDLSHSTQGFGEGNLRVPCFVSWPGQIAAGTVSPATIGPWDILPTLTQLAWVSRPIGRVDGHSLVDVLRHHQPLPERRIVWKSDDGNVLVARENRWKAVRREPNRFQLFDLSSDRAEEHDLSAENSAELQRLTQP